MEAASPRRSAFEIDYAREVYVFDGLGNLVGKRSRTSWYFQDLEPVKSGAERVASPTYLGRDDGVCLLYPGRAHSFVGDSETFKSWVALLACQSVLEAGGTALYVDFEASRTTFVKRARIVGIAEGDIDSRLRYIRPEDNWDDPAAEDFADALGELKPALVVFDGVTEALELAGLDMNKATDVARFQNALVRPALNVGAATVEIDHTGKDASRGAVGSQHKRAGLDGAQVTFKGARPAGEGGHSTVELVITKDREGEIRGRLADSKTIGTFHIDTSGDVTAAYIAAPSSAEAFDRFDAIMEDVSAFLERQPEPVSQRAVERNVSANSADVRNALHTLVDRGHVERFDGPRGSKMHRSARPYRRPGLATASASTPKGG